MKIGEKLDPLSLGHIAIDIKGLLLEHGYVMPQGSIAKLPLLPGEVQAEIARIKDSQEQYETIDESKRFECTACNTVNVSNWRKEVSTGTIFLVCGECQTVAEVK
jgi:hypothetical protein